MATSPPCPTWSFLRLANGKLPSTELAERSSRSSLSSRLATSRLLAATLASEEITPILEIRHWAWARTMQGLRSLLYCPVTTPNLDATSGLPIRKASFLARWGKRDSEEQGSLGGSMARHEQNEDSPLTRLELGRLRPKTLLAREPWQLVSKIRIPQLTRLGFWAGAPTTRSRGEMLNFFLKFTFLSIWPECPYQHIPHLYMLEDKRALMTWEWRSPSNKERFLDSPSCSTARVGEGKESFGIIVFITVRWSAHWFGLR